MRALLVIAVLHGLAPGLGEIVESALHFATTGCLSHSQPLEADPDQGEHGPGSSCCVSLHTCGCCAGPSVTPAVEISSVGHGASRLGQLERNAGEAVARAPARPFRPPIA